MLDTLALGAKAAEAVVFGQEHGKVWLSLEPTGASTGGTAVKVLCEAGLKVVGFDKGPWLRPQDHFSGDELKFVNRNYLWPDPSISPRTVRPDANSVAERFPFSPTPPHEIRPVRARHPAGPAHPTPAVIPAAFSGAQPIELSCATNNQRGRALILNEAKRMAVAVEANAILS